MIDENCVSTYDNSTGDRPRQKLQEIQRRIDKKVEEIYGV